MTSVRKHNPILMRTQTKEAYIYCQRTLLMYPISISQSFQNIFLLSYLAEPKFHHYLTLLYNLAINPHPLEMFSRIISSSKQFSLNFKRENNCLKPIAATWCASLVGLGTGADRLCSVMSACDLEYSQHLSTHSSHFFLYVIP